MKKRSKSSDGRSAGRKHVAHAIEGAAGGAAAGAAAGAIAGPVGSVAGAVLGGAAGAIAENILEREEEASQLRGKALDEEIGVTSGSIGAPNLRHPPARTGAYSAGSSGAGGGRRTLAEGPLQPPDDED
jgi:hypothetical protein